MSHFLNHYLFNRDLISRILVISRSIIGYLIEGILNSFDNEQVCSYFACNFIINEEISAHILVFDVVVKTINHLLPVFIEIESIVGKVITLVIDCIFSALEGACFI